MTDFDVLMDFTIPDVDKDAAEALVEDVATYIIDRTGWSVASRIVEADALPERGS